MNNDAERYFWTKTTDEGTKLGLSKDAQDELGNVTYIDLPKVGSELVAGQTFVSMEAEKAVSDMPSPISGTVTGLNPALADGTDALNGDWDEAWLLTFTPAK
ncbi:glycine cleavage system protein H [Furfurilactobacillus sp. WILCCON 0119]|uniref:glycine cleavage system protein H n=1 Tax=Furfurilactobacillus entadae TaxID=2922307 RepID=UPI0035E7171D